MIDAKQIPDEAVEAAVKAFDASEEDAYVSHAHDIRAAITAALNAWPGMKYTGPTGGGLSQELFQAPLIILPLPQEVSDE